MAIRKYTSGAWVPTSYRKYSTETDTITSLPAQIIGDGQAITSCQISGNTVQNGTPTPSDPVDVVGCGVWDEPYGYKLDISSGGRNLFDYQTMEGTIKGYYLDAYGELQPSGSAAVTDYIPCSGGSFALDKVGGISPSICLYDKNKQFLYGKAYNTQSGSYKQTIIVNTSFNASFIRFTYFYTGAPQDDLSAIMLNSGSIPLPYEPYNRITTPIYLGEVQTTRRIKKMVLTGEEGWTITSNGVLRIGLSGQLRPSTPLCTHYLGSNSSAWSNVPDKSVAVSISGYLAILDTTYTTAADFKSYLAAQYTAGTPVTVWYVLAEPETAVVNEPLHKIGNHADTVSATNIPTTGIPETFDVQTTLKPSEVQLTYHGWHEHADTKYTE